MRLRRNDVLKRMAGARDDQRGSATTRLKAMPLRLPEHAGELTRRHPPFFVKYLTDQIVENASGEFTSLGKTEKARRRALYEGGLDIHTTLRPDWQSWAEEEARKPLRVSIYPPAGSPPPDVSIVTIDNRSGAVKVILSGRNYREGRARPRDHRPPARLGVQALRPRRRVQGGHPPDADLLELLALVLTGLGRRGPLRRERRRDGGRHRSTCTPRPRSSINVVFAQLILDVGAGRRRGHRGADDGDGSGRPRGSRRWPALATGSVAISPIDMATGYQTIANDGRHCEPYTVQSIERDGKVLLEHERACDPVLKQGDARLITSMLEAVPVSGTAASAFGGWGSWPVAGKTGTAQENTNVWFGGYTKQFTTVVWVGSPGQPLPDGPRLRWHGRGADLGVVHVEGDAGTPGDRVPRPAETPRGPGAERDRDEAGGSDGGALGGGLPGLRSRSWTR